MASLGFIQCFMQGFLVRSSYQEFFRVSLGFTQGLSRFHLGYKQEIIKKTNQGFIWGFFRISFRGSLGFHLGILQDLHFFGVSFRVSVGFHVGFDLGILQGFIQGLIQGFVWGFFSGNFVKVSKRSCVFLKVSLGSHLRFHSGFLQGSIQGFIQGFMQCFMQGFLIRIFLRL